MPSVITTGNEPEFAGRALDEWACRRSVKPNLIRLDKSIENACAEGLIERLRDECLNENWFMNLKHTRDIIEDCRRDYNELMPDSSLHGRAHIECAETATGLNSR